MFSKSTRLSRRAAHVSARPLGALGPTFKRSSNPVAVKLRKCNSHPVAGRQGWGRVHLLLSEPEHGTLAVAIHYLKLSFAKRLRGQRIGAPSSRVGAPEPALSLSKGSPLFWANLGSEKLGSLWQKLYYDRNVRDAQEFAVKLRYLHRNPVKRGLVKEPGDWEWSSFRHYALRENGVVEIESEWTGRDRELKMFGGTARTFLSPG